MSCIYKKIHCRCLPKLFRLRTQFTSVYKDEPHSCKRGLNVLQCLSISVKETLNYESIKLILSKKQLNNVRCRMVLSQAEIFEIVEGFDLCRPVQTDMV